MLLDTVQYRVLPCGVFFSLVELDDTDIGVLKHRNSEERRIDNSYRDCESHREKRETNNERN